MKKTTHSKTPRKLPVTALAQVSGGAFEGYVEIEFAKQGKNKGTSP